MATYLQKGVLQMSAQQYNKELFNAITGTTMPTAYLRLLLGKFDAPFKHRTSPFSTNTIGIKVSDNANIYTIDPPQETLKEKYPNDYIIFFPCKPDEESPQLKNQLIQFINKLNALTQDNSQNPVCFLNDQPIDMEEKRTGCWGPTPQPFKYQSYAVIIRGEFFESTLLKEVLPSISDMDDKDWDTFIKDLPENKKGNIPESCLPEALEYIRQLPAPSVQSEQAESSFYARIIAYLTAFLQLIANGFTVLLNALHLGPKPEAKDDIGVEKDASSCTPSL